MTTMNSRALNGAFSDTNTLDEVPAADYPEKARRAHFYAWGWRGDVDLPAYAIVKPHAGSAPAIADAIARKNQLQVLTLRRTTYDKRNERQLWVMLMGCPIGSGMSRVVTEVHFREQ